MQNSNTSNKLIETKDLFFLWSLFIKNIGLIIFIPLLAFGFGYVYTYRLTDVYAAKAEILLKSNDTYDYQDKIYQGLGAYGVYMDVQNQIRILNSRDLVGEVIDKIQIGTSYYIVGRVKKAEVFETLPFRSTVLVQNESLYEVPVQIDIVDVNSYSLTYELNGQQKAFTGNFDTELVSDDFILNLDRRYSFNTDNINTLKDTKYEIVFHSRNYLINKYQSSLLIENIEHTSVLQLVVEDQLSQRAKVYLDSLTQTYLDYSKRIQLEVNENTLQNIQRQIDTASILIQEKERELLTFKDENAILNISKEEDDYFSEYITQTKERRIIQEKRSSALALKEYLGSTDDSRVLPPSFYIEQTDIYLRDAIGAIRSKQTNLEIKKTQVSEENLSVINLKREIQMLTNDVRLYIDNLLQALDNKLKIKNELIAEFKGNIKRLPKSAQAVLNIQRELDVNNKMYLFLLEKRTNTLIARAGIIPQVRIIEKAVIQGVVYPNKTKIIRLFVLAGLILALVIALIRKLFFERIENVNQLAKVSSSTILGGVPQVKNLTESIIVSTQPKVNVTESFRTIRTNLSFLIGEKPTAKKILISSFFPSEGKTFCSTNISTLIGMGAKKVIILDFDLHRPKVHKTFGLNNKVGVSNYLIGKSGFDEIVHKDISENLDIITAGPISPNPSELIMRDKVSELIAHAEEVYDFVIIDTPPFGLLNDTLELAKHVDALIVIMNSKYTRQRGVEFIDSTLESLKGVSTGVILNEIRESRFQHYYSKYTNKYAYGYNYGYGSGYVSNYGTYEDSE